jgi:hypothetical protein
MSIIYKTLETTRRLHKRVPLVIAGRQANGWTTEPDGHERVVYAVEMDFDALAALARKAAGNKSGKSRLGPLTIEVIQRERIS